MVRAEVTYRRAVAADAAALASFGSQSFVDAYGTSSTPDDVALHVARTYSVELQLAELKDPLSWTILGARGGEVVGAALMLRHEPPPPLPSGERWIEIKRFYVGRPYWKTGISADLMGAVLQSIREGGGTATWLQVWEHAAQAIGFYRKSGFQEAGQVPFVLGAEAQRDLLMSRVLPAA